MAKRTRLFKLNNEKNTYNIREGKLLNLHELMEKFIFYKKAQGLSYRTISDYQKHLGNFLNTFNAYKTDFETKKNALLDFFAKKRGKAPATYNIPFSNLNAFFNWMVDVEKVLEENPLKVLKLKKIKDEGRARHIEPNVIKKLLSVIDLSTYAGLRDYSIILLTLDTGIRPKEAFSLVETDIDFTYYSIKVRRETAKTRTMRTLPLSPQTAEVLKKLLSVKPDDWDDYVFCTSEGYQMTVERWEKRLRDYSMKL